MSRVTKFRMTGRRDAPEPYHYTGCGLDNIYLVNGFTRHSTPYGEGVSIACLDELHAAIAESLISKPGRLSPKELRFLRRQLDLTQEGFAKHLATEEQNIGRYERGTTPIPGTVDRLARIVYLLFTAPEDVLVELGELLAETLEDTPAGLPGFYFEKRKDHWQNRRVS